MDDPRILRVLTVGLVLAVLAVGYFLLTRQTQTTQLEEVIESPVPQASPIVIEETQQTATQPNVQILPNTGFPVGLAVVFSVGTVISGWSLRKFPK